MPSTLIDDLASFDMESLANWIDYVEQCTLKITVATQYKQSNLSDICALRMNFDQANALTKFLNLSASEQRAVIAIAKVLCRAMKQTPNRIPSK